MTRGTTIVRGKARGAFVAAAGLAALAALSAPAQAQNSGCQDGQKLLGERQSLIQQINGWQKKKVDPATACTVFTRLQSNGSRTLTWMEANKDWCQIPDQAVEAIRGQQGQVTQSRQRACAAAAQFKKMQEQARQQAQQQQQGGGLGGAFSAPDQITGGPMRVPQGAL
jgi:hypothetical protein